jgi:hypothetical protein
MAQTPLSTPELKLQTETTSDEVIVRCIGRLTYRSSEALRSRVRELVPESKRLVLDLKETSYLDRVSRYVNTDIRRSSFIGAGIFSQAHAQW